MTINRSRFPVVIPRNLLQALWLVCLFVFMPMCLESRAQEQPASSKLRVYLIGNSLTWDCVPAALGGQTQWHVDCGKNLKQIYDVPEKPCVPSSTIWPEALKANTYDVVCVQPHYGTTLDEDVQLIRRWIGMQPQAVLVLHSGWSKQAELEKEFETSVPLTPIGNGTATTAGSQKMSHSVAYMNALIEQIRQEHPKLTIRQTHAFEALHQVQVDIRSGQAPLKNISELYRDDIHLNYSAGRYLAHNLMRQAIGLPFSSQGFQLDDDLKNYLDKIITRYREVP